MATPHYQIRKDKKVGILVSPEDVTILGCTGDLVEEEVHFQASAHAKPVASTGSGTQEFVSKDDFDDSILNWTNVLQGLNHF